MQALESIVQRRIEILDCTLRDGSYAVNFQFTRRDTARLCAALDKAGVSLIEVGHGLGLGASSPKYGLAFERDREYLEAAAESIRRAKWGAFFIPGIGSKDDIQQAASIGLNFLRIGAEVGSTGQAREYAEYSRSLGLDVFVNLMKTYSASPSDISKVGREITSWGVCEAIYVVDSAGCMLPTNVAEYVKCLLDSSNCRVGFHGHNNLDLANANCLAAIEAGATFLDGSIRGMGRSAGNAQTEVLAFLLDKCGLSNGIDVFELFEAGDRVIVPLNAQTQGLPPLDIVIGMAKFHTSHLPRIRRVADQYDVDIRRLIIRVSMIDCVNPPDELVASVARDLSRVEP